jgi:beta-glucosidase
VQIYVRDDVSSAPRPTPELRGFQRVTLKPGESRQLHFELGFPELSFYDVHSRQVVEPTHYTVWVGGSSQATQQAEFDVRP